jgi:hypothetical protein
VEYNEACTVASIEVASYNAKEVEEELDYVIGIIMYCLLFVCQLLFSLYATIRYHKSDMILHIHSDASYLSVSHVRNRLCGLFYCEKNPTS